MTAMLKLIGWMIFTAVMAFVFLVLLDYGPARFSEGMQKESARVWAAVNRRVDAARSKVHAPAVQGDTGRTQAR